MKQILCYGDSNTWGLNPKTKTRYPWGVRWTSLLQEKFNSAEVRIIESGLCGRTTIFDDAYRENRNGLKSLPEILKSHYPIDAAIIMLGTNDCKSIYRADPFIIAKGMGLCVEKLKEYVPSEKIIVVSPIFLGNDVWKPEFDPEFDKESVDLSHRLYEEYKKVADDKHVAFVNAADFVEPSEADQEHFTESGHKKLADVMYEAILKNSIV